MMNLFVLNTKRHVFLLSLLLIHLIHSVHAGTLTNVVSQSFTKTKAGETGSSFTCGFTTTNPIPLDGKIIITLPGGFDTSSVTATINSGCTTT